MSNEDIESGLLFDNISHYDGNTPVHFHNEDMLECIYDLQKKLMTRYLDENFDLSDSDIGDFYMSDIFYNPKLETSNDGYLSIVKESLITDTANFIAEEAFELKRNFNYKSWKTWKQPNVPAAKEELIDLIHFVLQMSILLGLTPADIMYEFKKKNEINHKRQSGDY